jgi:hypothetical protein
MPNVKDEVHFAERSKASAFFMVFTSDLSKALHSLLGFAVDLVNMSTLQLLGLQGIYNYQRI